MATVITPRQKLAPPIIDEYNSTITYVGRAKHGAATSDAVWQIYRIYKNGTVTRISYADLNERFDNIWDDRTILSYS